MPKSIKIFNYIFWSFILILLFILQFSHFRLDSDNGVFLTGAWNLANNLEIYRYFFSFTAPGSYYLILIIWKIFGVNYWFAWIAGLLFLYLSAILIFKITVTASRPSAYLAVLMFSLSTIGWPIITSHIFCLPFVLGAIYLTIVGIEKKQLYLIYFAGIFAGISTIFLQTVGLATISGIFIFLLTVYFKEKTISIKNIALFGFFSIAPIVCLFFKWSPIYLFDNLIKFPITNYSTVLSINYCNLIIIFSFLLVFYIIFKKQRDFFIVVRLLIIIQLFLLITTISFPNFGHISFIFSPLLILFSILSVEFVRTKFKIRLSLTIIAALSFLFYFIFNFLMFIYFSGFSFLTLKNQNFPVINFIRENCKSKYIYAGPFIPEIYFESRKFSPGPTDWLLADSEDHRLLTIKGFIERKPDCAVTSYKLVEKFKYDRNNIVDNYILNNYQKVKNFGDISVLKRR